MGVEVISPVISRRILHIGWGLPIPSIHRGGRALYTFHGVDRFKEYLAPPLLQYIACCNQLYSFCLILSF